MFVLIKETRLTTAKSELWKDIELVGLDRADPPSRNATPRSKRKANRHHLHDRSTPVRSSQQRVILQAVAYSSAEQRSCHLRDLHPSSLEVAVRFDLRVYIPRCLSKNLCFRSEEGQRFPCTAVNTSTTLTNNTRRRRGEHLPQLVPLTPVPVLVNIVKKPLPLFWYSEDCTLVPR